MARSILASALLLGLALHSASAFHAAPASSLGSSSSRQRVAATRGKGAVQMAAGDAAAPINPDHDILLRVARGERAHRTPVWLMRQVRLDTLTCLLSHDQSNDLC
jgi:hypothetical protein